MADLSFLHQQGTAAAIDRAHEEARRDRGRLGLSQAGHRCPRLLWYRHRGIPETPPEGRVLRLFALGDAIERIVIGDLCMAGCQVYHQQRQVEFKMDLHPVGEVRLVGHIDGIVKGLKEAPETPHLLECKSANRKKFDELVKLSDYRAWNEVYWWQVQFYMLGLKLKRAAVFVYCKDDSRLYMERIRADYEAAGDRLSWVFVEIASSVEPERVCPRADNFEAKWCPYHDRCWGLGVRSAECGVRDDKTHPAPRTPHW